MPAHDLNSDRQAIIDKATEPWGVKVEVVEIKDAEVPESVQRTMARGCDVSAERRSSTPRATSKHPTSPRCLDLRGCHERTLTTTSSETGVSPRRHVRSPVGLPWSSRG